MNIKAFLDLGENVAVEFKRYGLCQVNVGNYLIFLFPCEIILIHN